MDFKINQKIEIIKEEVYFRNKLFTLVIPIEVLEKVMEIVRENENLPLDKTEEM